MKPARPEPPSAVVVLKWVAVGAVCVWLAVVVTGCSMPQPRSAVRADAADYAAGVGVDLEGKAKP